MAHVRVTWPLTDISLVIARMMELNYILIMALIFGLFKAAFVRCRPPTRLYAIDLLVLYKTMLSFCGPMFLLFY